MSVSGNPTVFAALSEFEETGHPVAFKIPTVMVMIAGESGLRHAAFALAVDGGEVVPITPMPLSS